MTPEIAHFAYFLRESTARSRFRYVRVMGNERRHRAVTSVFAASHISPRHIVGNVHTPAWVGWLGSLVPGSFAILISEFSVRSIAAEIAWHSREGWLKLPAKMQQ